MNTPLSSSLRAARRGFTLVELMVVIAIVGVLAGSMVMLISDSPAKARSTLCKNNLHQLAIAAQEVATQNQWGHYPAAGSYKFHWFSEGKLTYPTHRGWIGWTDARADNRVKAGGSSIPFSSGDNEMIELALTNGALWRAVGASTKVYQCPEHAIVCRDKIKRLPGWSYLMNQDFGYDSKSGQPLGGQTVKTAGGMSNARRLLIFAEMPGVDIAANGINQKAIVDGSGSSGDGVLEYAKDEVIGFNHKLGRDWIGNVAYADGHVAALLYPKGGMSLKELTKALCQGHELTIKGTRYVDQSK